MTSYELDDQRDYADHDHQDQDQLDVFLYELDLAKPITQKSYAYCPNKCSKCGKGDVLAELHAPNTCGCRDECAHDWYEARKHNRSSTVFLKEGMRALDVRPLEEPRVFTLQERWPDARADPIAADVAGQCSNEEDRQGNEQIDVDPPCGDRKSGNEQQRVSGEEESDQ